MGQRRGRGAIAAWAVIALGVVLPAREALGAPGVLDVTYAAPEPCPTRDALDAELARLLGPALEKGTPLTVGARVERAKDGRFRARPRSRGRRGARFATGRARTDHARTPHRNGHASSERDPGESSPRPERAGADRAAFIVERTRRSRSRRSRSRRSRALPSSAS